MVSRIHVTYRWECTVCDETGDTYPGVEKHAKVTGHTVRWVGRPS